VKITGYELFKVAPRWLFLKIETDEGITGWGEPVIEGRAETVRAAVHELMANLIGKDPAHIEDHWNMMYRSGFYRGGPILMSAIAGIDQALWDIKGKFYNAPVHQLLGGKCRDSIKVYSWIGGDRPSDVGTAAKEVVDTGFTAVKMNGTWIHMKKSIRYWNVWQLSVKQSAHMSASESTSTAASTNRWRKH
jgi:galactonate dehydratase